MSRKARFEGQGEAKTNMPRSSAEVGASVDPSEHSWLWETRVVVALVSRGQSLCPSVSRLVHSFVEKELACSLVDLVTYLLTLWSPWTRHTCRVRTPQMPRLGRGLRDPRQRSKETWMRKTKEMHSEEKTNGA